MNDPDPRIAAWEHEHAGLLGRLDWLNRNVLPRFEGMKRTKVLSDSIAGNEGGMGLGAQKDHIGFLSPLDSNLAKVLNQLSGE